MDLILNLPTVGAQYGAQNQDPTLRISCSIDWANTGLNNIVNFHYWQTSQNFENVCVHCDSHRGKWSKAFPQMLVTFTVMLYSKQDGK